MKKNLESKIRKICKEATAIVKNLGEGESRWHSYRIYTEGWFNNERFKISITESQRRPETVLVFYNSKEVFFSLSGEKPVQYYRRGKWESELDTLYKLANNSHG